MSLSDIRVPVYTSDGVEKNSNIFLVINKSSHGKIHIQVEECADELVSFACDIKDFNRAWEAVKDS